MIIKPSKNSNDDFYSISKIMYSLKRFTANSCNRLLDRKGQFWLHESYDHFVRDENDFEYQLNYLLMNPVNAKLTDKPENWQFSWVNEAIK